MFGRAQANARHMAAVLLLVFSVLSGGRGWVRPHDRNSAWRRMALFIPGAADIDNDLRLVPAARECKD